MNRPHRLRGPVRAGAALCAALAAVLLVPATPAWAHNALRESTPAGGARLAAAPQQVTLIFAERLDPKFTTIAVTAADRTTVAAGKPTVSGKRATQDLTPDLAAGTYTVAYRVVSVDGHPVQGSFTFTTTSVPASTTPTSTASASTAASAAEAAQTGTAVSPAASRQDDNGGGMSGVAVALLLGLVAVGAGVAVWRVRAARR